jgi:hypothetical protein
MKETPRRSSTVTSSLTEISTDQLGNRVVVRGVTSPESSLHPFLQKSPNLKTFKEPRNRFQGNDTKESIPLTYVAWQAGATNGVFRPARQVYIGWRNRSLGIDSWTF